MKTIRKIFALLLFLPIALSAINICSAKPAVQNEMVSLLKTPTNAGNLDEYGWYWDNINLVLTIKNLNLKTESEYGLKVQDGATVVILGNNYIEAEKAALYFGGQYSTNGITVKGNGTLTLKSSNGSGIVCGSSNKNSVVRFSKTNIEIVCGNDAIVSKNTSVSFSGGRLSIDTDENSNAVDAKAFTINSGCSFSSNAPIIAGELTVSASSISVASNRQSISADIVNIQRVKLFTGEKLTELSEAEAYTNESAVKTEVNFFLSTSSIIFGDRFSIVTDILFLIVLLAILAAVIIVPIVIRKKKAKRIITVIEAEEKARDEELKLKKSKKLKNGSRNGSEIDAGKN